MTTSTYMAALAALDEAPREEVSQVFISPLGDQSTEVDAAQTPGDAPSPGTLAVARANLTG